MQGFANFVEYNVGIGLIDYMIKSQELPDGTKFVPFGVSNDEENYYKKYRTNDMEENAIYIIKANAPLNTEAYTATQVALSSGKLKLLINSREAKQKLMSLRMGQQMTTRQRDKYLLPYVLTDILREELLNLREENEGVNIILKPVSKKIKKDKFSALSYGLYYIQKEEDRKRRGNKRSFAKWKFFN